MKYLVVFLLSISTVLAQNVNIKPVICSKTISTAFQTSGNDTVYSTLSTAFDSVAVGDQVYGPGFRVGTTVTAAVSSDTIVVSDTCTVTQDSVNFQIEVSRGAAYSSGDWLGFPFRVFTAGGSSGVIRLMSATITDVTEQIAATDIVLFITTSGDAGLDNAATGVVDNDEWGILGLTSLTTVTDMGGLKILTKDDINLAIPKGFEIWGRLVARSTPTFTATDNLRVRLRFQ